MAWRVADAADAFDSLSMPVPSRVYWAGDVKHNGVAYPEEHLRIHAHLYPPGYDHVGEIQFSQADPVTGE